MSKQLSRYDKEINNRLKTSASFQTHLANVISGMNHEVAPWLGSANNTITRLMKMIENMDADNVEETKEVCLKKLDKILYAVSQSSSILSMLSSNVKKLQNYSLTTSKLNDTMNSWTRVILMDSIFKNHISDHNIIIDSNSLDFDATHSPMLLSNIILNLAKNAVEHNTDMLDDLQIKIYGYPDMKALVFEDNGCGIPKKILKNIFSPNTTSKIDTEHSHGLGLSICMDYCIAMNATIWVKSVVGEYTRFIIKFSDTYETSTYRPQISGELDVGNLNGHVKDVMQEREDMQKIYKTKKELRDQQEDVSW